MPVTKRLTALIDKSEDDDLSEMVDLGELHPTHILFPAAMTGSNITFHVANKKDDTFVELVTYDGTAVSITVTASKMVSLAQFFDEFFGLRYLKLKSDGNEAADRTLYVYARPRA